MRANKTQVCIIHHGTNSNVALTIGRRVTLDGPEAFTGQLHERTAVTPAVLKCSVVKASLKMGISPKLGRDYQ